MSRRICKNGIHMPTPCQLLPSIVCCDWSVLSWLHQTYKWNYGCYFCLPNSIAAHCMGFGSHFNLGYFVLQKPGLAWACSLIQPRTHARRLVCPASSHEAPTYRHANIVRLALIVHCSEQDPLTRLWRYSPHHTPRTARAASATDLARLCPSLGRCGGLLCIPVLSCSDKCQARWYTASCNLADPPWPLNARSYRIGFPHCTLTLMIASP